jgi:hypothetical protein
LAALGVVILVVALVALRHPQGHSARAGTATGTPTGTRTGAVGSSAHSTQPSGTTGAGTTTPPPSSTRASTTPAAGGKLPLIVLNNTTIQGLAAQAAGTFRAGGWTVTRYDNYTNDIVSTCAYYDPATPGAQAAATALRAQFPAIKRVQPKFAELPAGPVVVVLTPDYVSG